MKVEKRDIIAFVEEYFKVYFTERNNSKIKPFLSPNLSVVGTGIHEIANTANDSLILFKKDFEEVTTPIKYSNLEINIPVHTDCVSIVSGVLSLTGEAAGITFNIDPIRYSFTVIKENESLKILHIHMSTPNDQQEEDELYPLQKLIKQNELLNQKVAERTKELVEANNDLKKSNQTKEKLFSIIAHDIKNPFNTLLGIVDILQSQYEDFDVIQQKKYIKMISDSSNKIYNLADNLLIWAKIQQDRFHCKLKPLNLRNIVQKSSEIYNEMLTNKKIDLKNVIDKSIIVLCDEFMLSTIYQS